MGHVPGWVRKNQHKVAKMADGGEVTKEDFAPPTVSVQGGGSKDDNSMGFGGKVTKRFDLDKDESISIGVAGHAFKAKTPVGTVKEAKVTGGEISYRNKSNEFSLSADKDEAGKDRYMLKYRKSF